METTRLERAKKMRFPESAVFSCEKISIESYMGDVCDSLDIFALREKAIFNFFTRCCPRVSSRAIADTLCRFIIAAAPTIYFGKPQTSAND
jgi:hypothetical protein